jgi:hypothetical protein
MRVGKCVSLTCLLIFFTGYSAIAQDKEKLLCLNTRCFLSDHQPTIVLKDSVALERTVNPSFGKYLTYGFQNPDLFIDRGLFIHEQSKFYTIQDASFPFNKKRIMNVASRDNIWFTDPEYESARPTISLFYFNQPEPPCYTRSIWPAEELY